MGIRGGKTAWCDTAVLGLLAAAILSVGCGPVFSAVSLVEVDEVDEGVDSGDGDSGELITVESIRYHRYSPGELPQHYVVLPQHVFPFGRWDFIGIYPDDFSRLKSWLMRALLLTHSEEDGRHATSGRNENSVAGDKINGEAGRQRDDDDTRQTNTNENGDGIDSCWRAAVFVAVHVGLAMVALFGPSQASLLVTMVALVVHVGILCMFGSVELNIRVVDYTQRPPTTCGAGGGAGTTTESALHSHSMLSGALFEQVKPSLCLSMCILLVSIVRCMMVPSPVVVVGK